MKYWQIIRQKLLLQVHDELVFEVPSLEWEELGAGNQIYNGKCDKFKSTSNSRYSCWKKLDGDQIIPVGE